MTAPRSLFSIALLLVVVPLSPAETPAQKSAADRARVKKLAAKYGIDIVIEKPKFPVKASYGTIDGKEATPQEIDAYLPRFLFEWDLYPVETVKKSAIKRVVLCKQVSFAGQIRNAIPDYENDTMYFEVVRGGDNDSYMRQVIHHEFFHVIDWKDDGIVYGDDRWKALNPKDFKYGNGGKNAQDDPTVSILRQDLPGFLNRYSQTGVEEDKAEVFAHMMIAPKMMAKRSEKDAVMRAKVQRMKELCESFSPKVDKAYWESIAKIDRPNLE